jgi:hypothetical protein
MFSSSSRHVEPVAQSLVLQRLGGLCWQVRFFDCALRGVDEYSEEAEYDQANSVTAGLVQRAETPQWSGARDCTGRVGSEVSENLILTVDRLRLVGNEGGRV